MGKPKRIIECFAAFDKYPDLSIKEISKKTKIPQSTLYNWRWKWQATRAQAAPKVRPPLMASPPTKLAQLIAFVKGLFR